VKKISKSMDQAIRNIYKEGVVDGVNSGTLKALQDRGLLECMDKLTPEGMRYAISLMPLSKQCEEILLNIQHIPLSYNGIPEQASLIHYQSLGYVGVSCEGIGIFTVLKALMLDKLAEYNQIDGRDDACTRYLQAQFIIHKDKIDEIILSIKSTSKESYLNNFSEIVSKQYIAITYPELSIEFAHAMYEAIELSTYTAVAIKIAEDPYKYAKGWPDLTLVRNTEVLFVEVKTTDKLHSSQLITIPVMREILPFEFTICKVSKLDNL